MDEIRPTTEEDAATTPEPPPTWDEIANDPDFQQKPADRQLIIYDRWTSEVLPYISKQPDWNDEQTSFLKKTEERRQQFSQAAGGITPDQARVKLAHEALRLAKPDGSFTPDEERVFLKTLPPDIIKAFVDDRAGVNKAPTDITKGDLPWLEGASKISGGLIPAPSDVNKVLVPIGAGMANAPGGIMNMLDYMEVFAAKVTQDPTRSAAATARMAERGEEAGERRAVAVEASGETWGTIGTIVGEQLPLLPLQLATGGLGYAVQGARGAVTASAIFGSLQSASQSFSSNVAERVRRGESVEAASDAELLPSIASGVITGAVTKGFGSGKFGGIERVFRDGGGKAVMSKLRETIIGAGGEMAEEISDEAGQILNDLTFGREVSLDDVFKRVSTAAVVAGILGGGVNGLHAALAPTAKIDPTAAAQEAELKAAGAPKTAEVVGAENRAAVERQINTTPEGVPPMAPVDKGITFASRQDADGSYKHEFSIPESATVEQLQEYRKNLDISSLPEEAAAAITTQLDAEIARKGGSVAPPAGPVFVPGAPGKFMANFTDAASAGKWVAENKTKVTSHSVATDNTGNTTLFITSVEGFDPSAALAAPATPPAPPQEAAGPRIVSTALRDSANPDNMVRGGEWNTGHDDFTKKALEAGIEPGTLEHGFIVRDPDGTERFVSREEAAPLAIASGQAAKGVTKLRSQDLINPTESTAMRGEDKRLEQLTETTELLSDPAVLETLTSKGLDALDVEHQQVVKRTLFAALHDPEIFQQAIKILPVEMINAFAEEQLSPVKLRNYKIMAARGSEAALEDTSAPEVTAPAVRETTKFERGRAEVRRITIETGIVPAYNALRKLAGDPTTASKISKELTAALEEEYPAAAMPDGARLTQAKDKLTGVDISSVIGVDGKVEPLFSNDPQQVAVLLNNGTVTTSPGSRLYIPDELGATGKVNPAIRVAKEKETGKRYVLSSDAVLPDGEILPIDTPDQLTEPWQAAERLKGKAQSILILDHDVAMEVAAAIERKTSGLKFDMPELGLEEGDADFDLGDDDTLFRKDADAPAISAPGLSDTVVKNATTLTRLGVGQPAKITNPIGIALKAAARDVKLPAHLRVFAQEMIKSGIDFSKVSLELFAQPLSGDAGLYISRADVEHGTIKVNVAAVHLGGVAETLLHEISHHVTLRKADPNYHHNPIEKRAYEQVNGDYNASLPDLFEMAVGRKGTPEEIKRWQKVQGKGKSSKEFIASSAFYFASDFREFLAGVLTSGRVQKILSGIKSEGPGPQGRLGNRLNSILHGLKQLFYGREVKPGSMLDTAWEAAMRLASSPVEQGRVGTGVGTSAELQRAQDLGAINRVDLENLADEKGMTQEEIMIRTSQELREFLGDKVPVGATTPKTKVISDRPYGWLAPNGDFIEAANSGHDHAAWEIIHSDSKLSAVYKKAVKENPTLDSLIEGRERLTDFMINNGFVRVVGDVGTTIYIQGKYTASQLRTLRDTAIEREVSLIQDNEKSQRTLYSPDTAAQKAASPPEIVHSIGNDGKVVHSVEIPETATPEQITRLTEQVAQSKLLDADKQRLTQEIEAQARTNAQNAVLAANVALPVTAASPTGNGFFNMISKVARKYMTAEGNLTKDVFHRWQQREGDIKAATREASYTLRDLYNGVQEEFGISTGGRFLKGLSDVPPEFVRKMNDALLGKVPMSALPDTVRGPLQIMRAQIDHLSQQFVDSGLAAGDLAARFAENFGVYMTRSYRVFDDPVWADSIPIDVRNRTRAFLTSELKQDNPNATELDADRLMASLLQDWKEQGDTRGVAPGRGPKLGAMNQTIFMKRGDIAPEMREFMGEYQDPAINFIRSVTKMAGTLSNARFLADVRAKGLGNFLFEEGTEPAGFASQIAAEGSAMMAPLNGLRTSPEIAEAFREFGKAADVGSAPFRFWMKIAAASKGAKTIGSLMTQIRNAQQFWFFGMNGHYDMTTAREAIMATGADLGMTDSPQWRAFYTKMTKLNVVNQSAQAGELRDTIREALLPTEAGSEFSGNKVKSVAQFGRNVSRATFGVATRAYQISDDAGKIIGFLNERARQEKVHPDWTPEQLDTEAAQRIRLTYPSYSMVPETIKVFRRQPLFGPFVTFGYETLRTTYHNLRFTTEAIQNARKATDPAIAAAYRTEAAQRMAGQMAVLGGAGLAASLITRMLLGLSAEEEDDARKFLPEWDKNAQLLFTGKENGKLSYVNISYSNPYSLIPDAVGAITRGIENERGIITTIANATKEFLSPFTGENILAGATLDVMRNKRASNGRPVYNEGDTAEQRITSILGRFYESLEPGTLTRVRTKIIPAARGETRRGQELSVVRELTSEFTGFKAQKMEFRDALGYKGSDFARTLRETDDILRQVVLREGNVSAEDIISAYQRSEGQRFMMFQQLQDVALASIRRGVPTAEVRSILQKRGNVSKEIVAAVMADRYKPQDLSKDVKKRLREMKRIPPPLMSPYKGRSLSGANKTMPKAPVEL